MTELILCQEPFMERRGDMDRKLLTKHIQIDQKLPAILCGNLKIPCGQRRKNRSCKCSACGYAIQTHNFPLNMKEVLVAYSRGRD